MNARPQRIGMFGGAFDPPHHAHVALAQAAVEQLELDRLLVFPTGQAWHKARALSPAQHRLAMTRLAFAHLPAVTVDDRELHRSGPTYTVDTLTELRSQWPQAQLWLVLGADHARALPSWSRWQQIRELAIISIASRDDLTLDQVEFLPEIPDIQPPGGGFVRLHMPAMPVSATEIRQRVATGQRIDHLVAPGVARYIEQHHLYLAP